MGKAKKRGFALKKRMTTMTREEAVNRILKNIEQKEESIELITLFGISAEELLEGGATYEDVVAFGRIFE